MSRFACWPYGSLMVLVLHAARVACGGGEPIGDVTNGAADAKPAGDVELLRFVTIPEKDLPRDVRLAKLETAPLVPVTENPQILVDPQGIRRVAAFFGLRDAKSVRAAAVAIYQHREPAHEIGVYGLRFADEPAARQTFERLTGDVEDPPYLLRDDVVLYVWRDDGADAAAGEAVRKHFETAALKPAAKP